MLELSSRKDIAALRESSFLECKLAQGRDGLGALPKNIWETYSAFANTEGGDIILGVEELADKSFELAGIVNVREVLDELWMGLDDPCQVSTNLVSNTDAKVITIDGKKIIHLYVPQASKRQRPVFINDDAFSGTYLRFDSADIKVGEDIIRRMMSE